MGALGYGVSAYLDFKGLEFITAQLERLVLFTYPLFVMFLGALFFGQKITRYGIIACVISYVGLAIVVGLDLPAGGWNTVIGTSLVLGCAITFAFNQLYAKQLITVLGSVFYTAISMVAGGIAAVLIHAVSDGDFGASSVFLWMALGTRNLCHGVADLLHQRRAGANLSANRRHDFHDFATGDHWPCREHFGRTLHLGRRHRLRPRAGRRGLLYVGRHAAEVGGQSRGRR